MAGLTNSNEQSLGLPPSPFCRDLRSKKYFSLPSVPTVADDILDPSNHCWCRRTMQVVGPDGDFVHPGGCHDGRECYVSAWSPRDTPRDNIA